MEPMSDIDKAKFKELFEKGLLTARPPEVWLPQKSKDGEWRNHFIGSTGVPMHLSGGWMINESTGSLKQVDIDDIDFSPTNISDYITGVSTEGAQSQDPGEIDSSASTGKTKLVWKLPSLALLGEPVAGRADAGDVQQIANNIIDTISEFGINAEAIEANIAHKVTQYLLQLPKNVQAEKIMQLESNIALNLQATSIRITKSTPRNGFVAIEVPNVKAADVPLASIFDSTEWRDSTSPLSIAVGKDLYGKPVIADLSKIEHLLFAGQTGSGKSVMSNAILASLLFRNNPDELKLMLVDPKQVELAPYQDLPHLLMPVIERPEQWSVALNWLSKEVDRRKNILAHYRVSLIDELNRTATELLPRVVVLTDELSDLMMVDGRKVEEVVSKISTKAKNFGIHLIFSTSRPSVDVFTDILKASMPTHWSFVTASKLDSMTTLDEAGAEKLLGQGDLLFREDPNSSLQRVQAAYISDDEVESLTSFWSRQSMQKGNDVKDTDNEVVKSDLMEDFEYFVTAQVGHHYKKGFRWKAKLRWQLVKVWQSRITNMGVPGLVKEKLGEEEAQRLYEDIADRIMNDPELLEEAVKTAHKSNPFS